MENKQILTQGELMQSFTKLLQQIKTCDEFIALSMRSEKLSEQIQGMKSILNKTYETIVVGNEDLLLEIDDIKSKYQSVMRRLQLQTYTLLEYLQNDLVCQWKQRQNCNKAALDAPKILIARTDMLHFGTPNANNCLKSIAKSPMPSTIKKNTAMDIIKVRTIENVPKMSLADYKASPLTKSVNLKFDAQLQQQHFDNIPKYMRGRETLECLKQFLEQIISPCFYSKYQLLQRKRSTIRNLKDLDLWKLYTEQVSLAPGLYFITQGDISRHINKMLDKKMQNRLVMLRHIGLLQERHVLQTKCYIWNEKFILN